MTCSNSHSRKLLIGLGLVFLCNSLANAQQAAEKFNPGVVIESVVSASDPTKSYALYLPTTYTAARRFPVLYCFDPGARGAVPVARFKDAAEKYEYIVVGSNNSRNGLNQPLSEIVRDLWEDTHARFSIDDHRAYLAGFSGGARVAISIAFSLKGLVAGVIACSAGFPVNIPTNTPRSFVLFATTGIDDFNNPEVQSLARKLAGSTPPVRLAVFEGGHEWLPPPLATDALQWLEIQAMKSGVRERNPVVINEVFDHALSQALAAEASGDRYRAYLRYAAMAQDFSALHDVTNVEKKAKALSATKEINDAAKQEKKMEEEQTARIESLHSRIRGAFSGTDDSFPTMVALRDELRSLREAANGTEPSVKRTVARRVRESLFIEFVEEGHAAMSQKQYASAVTNYSICSEIQPDNARIFYHLARAQALAGSRNKALVALKTAADKGFTGLQELAGKEFEDLQSDKRFNEIIDLVKKNQSSHLAR